jgi:catechol 2,3-dioxygenase-like lactoylglutathione lyase family enzyme
MNSGTKLRVARPTDQLEQVVRFYTAGVGLEILGSFEDHDGFDGVILGLAGMSYHLEFTRKAGTVAGRAPTLENLLVFYFPDVNDWNAAIKRMSEAGYRAATSFNPYWDSHGRTFEDPDGYRVVLQNGSWPPPQSE